MIESSMMHRNYLEAPLLRLDKVFHAFTKQVNGHIDINYKDAVSRHITVEGADGLTRKIQIGPVLLDLQKGWVEGNYKYLIALMPWKDVDGKRWVWTYRYPLYSDLPNEEEMK